MENLNFYESSKLCLNINILFKSKKQYSVCNGNRENVTMKLSENLLIHLIDSTS